MKRFLIYLTVILVAVALGFTVFYLTRNNEKIYISTSSVYMREGDEIDDLSIIWENKKAFSEYEVLSSNEGIAKYNKETGKLKAVGGGIATITFRTSSVKFRNLSCQVYVGNGSLTNPYYITNADQLRAIGESTIKDEDSVVEYGLDKCYKLVTNIDLLDGYYKTGFWIPIGTGNANGFTGNFDGNGYTISNISVDKERFDSELKKYPDVTPGIANYNTFVNAGLFSKIGINGRVCNLKINNIIIHGVYTNGYVGGVAGQNYGAIERTEVENGHIDVIAPAAIGGITAQNLASEITVSGDVVRNTARIDRCAAFITMGITKAETSEEQVVKGVSGKVGGVAGINDGGIVIYSYSRGNVYLNTTEGANIVYGGLVGENKVKVFEKTNPKYLYNYSGAHIKDSYSAVQLKNAADVKGTAVIGGIIGTNADIPALDLDTNGIEIERDKIGTANKIVGNYYDKELLNPVVVTPAAQEEVTPNPDDQTQNPNPPTDTETPAVPEIPVVPSSASYIGIGRSSLGGEAVTPKDEKYVVMGKTTNELKLEETYLSHVRVEKIYNEETSEYETKESIITWKMDVVWFIKDQINNGYPCLNYANIEISDELVDISDGYTIRTYNDLKNMKLDGNYILAQNIVCPDNEIWVPIGTVSRPFYGSLRGGKYKKAGAETLYTISNLRTSANAELMDEIEFAGLFGVTSGAQGKSIEDIVLVNPTFTNAKIAGGIVASNGYGKEYSGLNIINCKVLGGTIRATEKVGGIVGDNFGQVTGCSVSHSTDTYENTTKLDVILHATSENVGGGIAGYNNSNGTISGSTVLGQVAVVARSGEGSTAGASLGGIVGHNAGTVDSVVAIQAKGVMIEKIKGQAGGIAGINEGNITKAISSTEIAAPTDKAEVYAGGLVGKMIQESKLEASLARKGSVTGYNAGGLVGLVNYSKPDYRYDFAVSNDNKIQKLNGPNTIYQCAVFEFSVTGECSAGLAATVENGIIRDCYTQATLYGVTSGSVKAGFSVNLNLGQNHSGIIVNCYTASTFGSGNGDNYAVTPKEIYKNPAFTLGVVPSRSAGYCLNFLYNKDNGGKEPDKGNFFVDNAVSKWVIGLFDKDQDDSATSGEMKGSSPAKFNNREFSTEIWQFTDGAYPSLKTVNALPEQLHVIF